MFNYIKVQTLSNVPLTIRHCVAIVQSKCSKNRRIKSVLRYVQSTMGVHNHAKYERLLSMGPEVKGFR